MDYHNPYARIDFYRTFMKNDFQTTCLVEEFDRGVSINYLHLLSSIPLSVIRRDILTLFEWQHSLVSKRDVYSDEDIIQFDTEEEPLASLFDSLYDDSTLPEDFVKELVEGQYDDIPLYISYNSTEIRYSLSLTAGESVALQQTLSSTREKAPSKEYLRRNFKEGYLVKGHYQYNLSYVNLDETLKKINDAISQKRYLRIRYKEGSHASYYTIVAIAISYDASDNSYAVIAKTDGTLKSYRVDKILSLELLKKHELSDNELTIDHAPQVWGNNFSAEPIHVKVFFRKEANVIKKVRKDLACRTLASITETPDGLYYEDTVYGSEKFRSWLRGYGSSAIVLEPDNLQKKVISSLLKAAESYAEEV